MPFPTIPLVADGRVLSVLATNPAGTHTSPNLSSLTKNAGDLLIAIVIIYDGNSTNAEFSSWGGGFTEFSDNAGTTTMGIGAAYKWSTGSETGTFTVTSADASANDSAFFLLSIPGAHATTPPEAGGFATGITAAADPASFDPGGWDAEDTLWIAVRGSGETGTGGSYTGLGNPPTNYTGSAQTGISADAVGGVEGGVSFRQLNAANEDVGAGTCDVSNARNAVLVIAVRPAVVTQLFLRNEKGEVHLGTNNTLLTGAASGWDSLQLATSRGGSLATLTRNTTAGPTTGLEWVNAWPAPIEWISPPVSEDVTISSAITGNFWASESSLSANAAINFVVDVIRATNNAIVEIAKSTYTTELALTTRALNNFTATPGAGVTVNKGDRIRLRVFIDDAGTMATGFTASLGYAGSSAAADGDSYIAFTEIFTFDTDAPTGSVVYLTDAASTVSVGTVEKEAWTARGSGVVSKTTNLSDGWTAPIQTTDGAGGGNLEWYTRGLQAFTLAGLAKASIRFSASGAAFASAKCEIARVDNDGTNASVWASWCLSRAEYGFDGQLDTSAERIEVFYVSGDDLSISTGQRLRIRLYYDDTGQEAMEFGTELATVFYNGASGGASGDSFITLAQTIAESGNSVFATVTDALNLADTIGRTGTFLRSITDTIIHSDAAAHIVTLLRSASDALTLADVITSAKTLARAVVDTLSLGDVATRAKSAVRTVTDALSLGDISTRAQVLIRSIVDALTLSDASVRLKSLVRSVTDTLNLADVVTRLVTLVRTTANNIVHGDVAVRTLTSLRTAADALSLTDVVSRAKGAVRTVTDALSASDVASKVVSLARTAVDALSLGDVATRIKGAVRSTLDAISHSDTATRLVALLRTTTDALNFSDVVAGFKAILRFVSDALGLSDVATRAGTFARNTADTLTLGDLAGKIAAIIRVTADFLGISDVATRTVSLVRSIVDSISISDVSTRLVTLLRSITDALSLSDTATRVKNAVRSAADALGLSDVAVRIATFLKTAADALSLADVAVRAKGAVRSTTDAIAHSDVATRIASLFRSITDGISFSDVVDATLATIQRFATDTLALADNATRTLASLRAAVDSISLGDIASRATNAFRSAVDSITHSDAVEAVLTAMQRFATDTLSLADSAVRSASFVRTGIDSIAHSDVVTRVAALLRATTDALNLSDIVSGVKTVLRTASDALGLTDVANRVLAAIRQATDSLSFSNLAERAVVLFRTTVDALSLTDIVNALKIAAINIVAGFAPVIRTGSGISRTVTKAVTRLRSGNPPRRLR